MSSVIFESFGTTVMTHAVLVKMQLPGRLREVSLVPTDSGATQANPPTVAPMPSRTKQEGVSPTPCIPIVS